MTKDVDGVATFAVYGPNQRLVWLSVHSLGMRQRLGLAAALLRAPRLLILDEPTNGLDPQGIREIRELLVELNEGGTTVFVCSHLLAEVEQLCTKVGVIDRGRLVIEEHLSQLRAATGRVLVRSPDATPGTASAAARRMRTTAIGRSSASEWSRPSMTGRPDTHAAAGSA
jgi:ABC-type multidrug transport system ATPase subunit